MGLRPGDQHLFSASHPVGQQHRGARSVRINVEIDLLAFACLCNQRQGLLRQAEILFAAAFVMGNDHGNAGALSDLQGFPYRVQHATAFVAHVGRIDSAVPRDTGGELDYLVRGRVEGGGIR